jgi:para-nitrobenzyl esterase
MPASTSEDCLYLNVTTPHSGVPDGPRPVMVWVHGGGFTQGAGSDYDPYRLAVGGDVVVVTVNYRLGIFGFYGHPGLTVDSGAFGLEDQQAALRWVQRNARAFGGDPHNVTLFGESAGGLSTCAHLTSPSAAGLFHRTVIQSGPCMITWPNNGIYPGVPAGSVWLPRADVEAVGTQLATSRGCADPATALACLRRLPVNDLMSDQLAPMFFAPAFDTGVLPESPARALSEGRIHRVPVVSGNTRDEGRLFATFFPDQPITEQRYQQLLRDAFGDKADQVAAQYPTSASGTPGMAWADVMSDRVWACPTLIGDRLIAARTQTYGYEFADRHAPAIFPFPPSIEPGAYHGSEVAYLFDLAGLPVKLTPKQQRLSGQMIRYWARFAATGDPNGPGVPKWRSFPTVQSLAPRAGGIGPVDLGALHNCGFWSSIG